MTYELNERVIVSALELLFGCNDGSRAIELGLEYLRSLCKPNGLAIGSRVDKALLVCYLNGVGGLVCRGCRLVLVSRAADLCDLLGSNKATSAVGNCDKLRFVAYCLKSLSNRLLTGRAADNDLGYLGNIEFSCSVFPILSRVCNRYFRKP